MRSTILDGQIDFSSLPGSVYIFKKEIDFFFFQNSNFLNLPIFLDRIEKKKHFSFKNNLFAFTYFSGTNCMRETNFSFYWKIPCFTLNSCPDLHYSLIFFGLWLCEKLSSKDGRLLQEACVKYLKETKLHLYLLGDQQGKSVPKRCTSSRQVEVAGTFLGVPYVFWPCP